MTISCSYCSALTVARQGNNFCSNQGDNLEKSLSNAFYIKSSQISSGSHISRLTIRSVFEGYQFYNVDGSDHMVKQDNYLIVNQGQHYQSEIDSTRPLEALIVAFNPDSVGDYFRAISQSHEHLLDNPSDSKPAVLEFFRNTYASDPTITFLLKRVREGILNGESNLFFEDLYHQLLERMCEAHHNTIAGINSLPLQRISTKMELYRRLGTAKDYIDAHLHEDLDIERISQAAALSSFHFVRMFKVVYGQTPYGYLTNERMKLAAYLLSNSEMPVGQVCQESGFENLSSFGRLFRISFGKSATQFRMQA